MNYTTIRIEGAILSGDILDKLAQGELGGQLPKDFGFEGSVKVKDEIARAWADNRVSRIYGGTTEIMKEIIGRSLGV